MELPVFKTKIIQIGNTRGLVLPAKISEYYRVDDDGEYWVYVRLEKDIEVTE
jgi:hypothetical protein